MNDLVKQSTRTAVGRAMQAEMSEFPHFEKYDPAGNLSGNSRNRVIRKTLKGDFAKLKWKLRGIGAGV